MAHKFNPAHKSSLHSQERLASMPPGETLINLGLEKDDIFVDVGCGTGYFTEGAVSIISDTSRIYALDTSSEMLEALKERLSDLSVPGLDRLNTVQTAEYDFKVPDNTATFCILSFVLHEVDDKSRFLLEGKRIVQPGGTLAVIEWERKPTVHGPPMDHRLEKSRVAKWFVETGFSGIQLRTIGTDYYAVTGRTA